jgi:hypothetical protein
MMAVYPVFVQMASLPVQLEIFHISIEHPATFPVKQPGKA